MANILEINNLSKSFGENLVLQNINLQLQKGEICTLIGGNGTGKTTLFNLITGFRAYHRCFFVRTKVLDYFVNLIKWFNFKSLDLG